MKKVPLRMCIVCRQMKPKKELIRVVRGEDGVISVDPTGKANGRGAYICNSEECLSKLVKSKALNRSFKENVSPEVCESLKEEYERNKN